MVSKVRQRLRVLAIWLLSGVLAPTPVARIWPQEGHLARADVQDRQDRNVRWPETLQLHPWRADDPVRLVRISKDGKELMPGKYRLPRIAGKGSEDVKAVKQWLDELSFVLRSETSKNIVSVGISVVLPVRITTNLECAASHPDPWCDAHPHWCDGGCPSLFNDTLHWGVIPGLTASGLEARLEARDPAEAGQSILLNGQEPLRLAPGDEITLSLHGRVDERMSGFSSPRANLSDVMNGIVFREGIEEARDTEPCNIRASSKTGCAFAEVSKFNIGLDMVYFEDGTIWGNYGYGYALPNPDGIFTRVDARDFPGIAGPGSAQR